MRQRFGQFFLIFRVFSFWNYIKMCRFTVLYNRRPKYRQTVNKKRKRKMECRSAPDEFLPRFCSSKRSSKHSRLFGGLFINFLISFSFLYSVYFSSTVLAIFPLTVWSQLCFERSSWLDFSKGGRSPSLIELVFGVDCENLDENLLSKVSFRGEVSRKFWSFSSSDGGVSSNKGQNYLTLRATRG